MKQIGLRRLAIAALALSWLLTEAATAQVLIVGPKGPVGWDRLSSHEMGRLAEALGEPRKSVLQDYTVYHEPLAETGPESIIAVSTHFGANPNSGFLVFRQTPRRDVLILFAAAGDWKILASRHHQYRDLVLTEYEGVHRFVTRLQFDGQQYRAATCTEFTQEGAESRETPCGASS